MQYLKGNWEQHIGYYRSMVHQSSKSSPRPGVVAHAYNPSTLGGRGGWIMRSRDRDHPGQQGETPSLLKIQKLAGHGGACLWSHLLGRLKQKNCLNPGGGGCGEPRSRHCSPAWVTEWDYISKKKKEKRKKKRMPKGHRNRPDHFIKYSKTALKIHTCFIKSYQEFFSHDFSTKLAYRIRFPWAEWLLAQRTLCSWPKRLVSLSRRCSPTQRSLVPFHLWVCFLIYKSWNSKTDCLSFPAPYSLFFSLSVLSFLS